MDREQNPASKQPYEPPTLVIYGTVQDLTQMNGRSHQPDGPPPKITHTVG